MYVYILLVAHLGYNPAKNNLAISKINPTKPNQTKLNQ